MSTTRDQQPLRRTVGRREARDGRPLTAKDRAALASNARYRTRAPKGIFIYYSAADMEADRRRWAVDAVVAKTKQGVRPKDQLDAEVIAEALRRLDDRK